MSDADLKLTREYTGEFLLSYSLEGIGKTLLASNLIQEIKALKYAAVQIKHYHLCPCYFWLDSRRAISEEQRILLKLLFPCKDKPYSDLLLPLEYKQLLQILSREKEQQEIKTLFPENYHRLCVLLQQLDLPASSTDLPSIIKSLNVMPTLLNTLPFLSFKCGYNFRFIEKLLEIKSLLIKRTKLILEDISTLAIEIRHLLAFLKKLIIAWLRLQFIAYQIHNRTSHSPTSQKKEPPIGGVKIGGKQHDYSRHVAEILYLEPIFRLKQAA